MLRATGAANSTRYEMVEMVSSFAGSMPAISTANEEITEVDRKAWIDVIARFPGDLRAEVTGLVELDAVHARDFEIEDETIYSKLDILEQQIRQPSP